MTHELESIEKMRGNHSTYSKEAEFEKLVTETCSKTGGHTPVNPRENWYGCVACAAIAQALEKQFRAGMETAIRIAVNHSMTDARKEMLRCNSKGKSPYVGTQEMNGFDCACDEIAKEIRNLLSNQGDGK